ncbi:chorismate synthase [Suttonella ornithocola]|uniref:Chorismate synthase n=1 Tax=Suttonella ornithocola TaxID=279832 RepID=A0A380MZK7_9GAMM|nr:chorismate synthase [Suttonella ornithocola]SUO97313.1 Chorismate synthase [Suttonella ornithocola]
MSGNTIGKLFTLTTFGESHGVAIGGIIDGCPAGIAIDIENIQKDLDRRKPGTSRHVTPRSESDTVQLLSGTFEGQSTGTPIGFVIYNEDQRSKDYSAIKDKFRPGHADYTYWQKYGIRDYRGGGRSSARETASRVAGGAIAKAVLQQLANVQIRAYVSQIGEHKLNFDNWESVSQNPFNCPNEHQVPVLDRYLYDIRKSGDSIGAEITLVIDNLPTGLGEPVFDRLDADLAHAMMSINAVKGVAIGDGFDCVSRRGSEFRDERTATEGFISNHAGGILGGISSGQQIIVRTAFKPTSSILIPGRTTDTANQDTDVVTKGRHDPCVGLRACPIVEAMAALVLCDHYLRQRGQNNHF